MAPLVPFLLILPATIGFLLMLPASSGAYSNFLLSGRTLGTDQQLSDAYSNFIMQGDCNLVMYTTIGPGFQSNTANRGSQCSVTLSDRGQLIIRDGRNSTVWSTPAHSQGNYAAVLRKDGVVAIYGPQVWSTPDLFPSAPELLPVHNILFPSPIVDIQFSGQILDNVLKSRDYTFQLEGCNLILYKGGKSVWKTEFPLNWNLCYARLDHVGRLSIVTDDYKVIFTTESKQSPDHPLEYVLILQLNGQAVIYGPIVWVTAATHKGDMEISTE